MQNSEIFEDRIMDEPLAKWAFYCSLVPVLGIPFVFILSAISLYRIGKIGYTGATYLGKGFVIMLIINAGLYLSGFLPNCYFFLPKHGIVVKKTEKGFIGEIPYRFGKKDGKEIWWDQQGRKMSELEFSKGLRNGVYRAWTVAGDNYYKSEEINYKNDIIHGKWILWNSNNHKIEEREYVNGEVKKVSYWDNNGNLDEESSYENANLDGFHRLYYHGRLLMETQNRKGRLISTTAWDDKGNRQTVTVGGERVVYNSRNEVVDREMFNLQYFNDAYKKIRSKHEVVIPVVPASPEQ